MTPQSQQPTAAGHPDPGRLMRFATYASVAAAAVLIAAKLVAWSLTGSVAVLSTLVDSLLDLLASLVTLFAVRQALTPADREHRFGHGKAEPLAAVAQSAFIAGSSVLLLFEAGNRLVNPQPVTRAEIGIGVTLFAILVTLALVGFQRWVVRRSRSVAIAADSLHYSGDLLTNLAVIAALVLTQYFGWAYADPIFGGGVAVYILYNAYLILRDALDMLMDRELPEAERRRIRKIVAAHPEVRDLHDLRTRQAGQTCFIQFHLELDGAMTLRRAHDIADDVERALAKAYPGAEIIVHEYPEGLAEEHRSRA